MSINLIFVYFLYIMTFLTFLGISGFIYWFVFWYNPSMYQIVRLTKEQADKLNLEHRIKTGKDKYFLIDDENLMYFNYEVRL